VNEAVIIELGKSAIETTAMMAAPMLVGALVVGLIISVMQAITQINEATLTFIPKMLIVGIIFVVAAPWMLDLISNYAIQLFENIPLYVRN